jgi:arsenate reductase
MKKKNNVFSEIETLVRSFDFEEITTERKNTLQPLIDFIQQKSRSTKRNQT